MPSHGYRKTDPLTERVKVQFTVSQTQALAAKADAVGMTAAAYVRALVLKELDLPNPEKSPTSASAGRHAGMLQVAELHALAMQIKKLGTNVNQLARQANTGMVPITRAEVIYILDQHQLLMSQAFSAVERMLK